MAKSRRKTYKSRKVQVDLAELQTIVEATSERPLTEYEYSHVALLQPSFRLVEQPRRGRRCTPLRRPREGEGPSTCTVDGGGR